MYLGGLLSTNIFQNIKIDFEKIGICIMVKFSQNVRNAKWFELPFL